MDVDLGVGREGEKTLQFVDMGGDALAGMAVGIVNQNIRRMAFLEAIPLVVRIDVEIERIEGPQVRLANAFGRPVTG
ncbi:hypothetical protein [Caulobacter sp. DWP3-1-3b2]|uniref:hypothetical protein n=1 Tax=Caulobacter sp. DWP3-1-3b2 TaxID=2804643 RepID=UPI003CF9DE8B